MKENTEIRERIVKRLKMKFSRSLALLFVLAGMLPPMIFRAIHWYNGDPLGNWLDFTRVLLISMGTTLSISYGVVSVLIWLQNHYPWKTGIVRRIFLEITLTTLTSCILIVLLTLLSHLIVPKKDLLTSIFNYLIVAIVMNFILVAITEGIFFFREWRKSIVESERFKKESIRAQLESLKNQVNPHFLFNSLNTLSSLIDHDKEMSKEFLDDLSTVYRYVLQNKDEEIVAIKTELEFIQSFTHLLKKRHGDGVHFHFNIANEDLNNGIPPMTLQLLIENAVKHNIASRKKPLKVEVFSLNNRLTVRNNLQPRKQVNSTGIGLKNIERRYQFLIDQNIKISKSNQLFEVTVPTIPLN